jgi:collagenase-like PrtC family protease
MSIANDFNNNIDKTDRGIAHYHLPGLFEFYEFYKVFLPLFYEHREYFYDWCDIGSIYGAPADCIWGGGRAGFGDSEAEKVFSLMAQYGISARLTFSNSLIRKEHLADIKCNKLCELLEAAKVKNGIIVHSDILLDYLKNKYPEFYFVSSTTKVLTDYNDLLNEVNRDDFSYVVPDFRLNKCFDKLETMTQEQKDKIEFLCNECCWIGCYDRKACYEAVSRMNLGENCNGHICVSSEADEGYRFSKAMHNPAFISVDDIRNIYMPMGFTNFKIEGRSLGSALVLEFLLYYMTKPEYQINVREEIYLDNTLDIF